MLQLVWNFDFKGFPLIERAQGPVGWGIGTDVAMTSQIWAELPPSYFLTLSIDALHRPMIHGNGKDNKKV